MINCFARINHVETKNQARMPLSSDFKIINYDSDPDSDLNEIYLIDLKRTVPGC